ncbi:protein-tyrosine phosphatase family protein [Sansalvadorimonas verongulae]|uniref:protein-tyrosine phosphatase family protein n=1 Tax=Sansalvadorimonas verongulae TaxID=2172824 RepID=UPI0018AD1E44|nr:protein-tyrosine phosphatase family protein [Sansalvadorimonas verongulae]
MFGNVPLTRSTCVNIGTDQAPRLQLANQVSLEIKDLSEPVNFILSQIPSKDSLPSFLEMLYQKAGALVILETTRFAYWEQLPATVSINGQDYEFSMNDFTKSEGIEETSLFIKNCNSEETSCIPTIIAYDWADMSAFAENSFEKLVASTIDHEKRSRASDKHVVVHCRAGVGRSGALAVRTAMSYLIQAGTIESEQHLMDALVKLTNAGKQERSPLCVTKFSQFEMVYTSSLKEFRDTQAPLQPAAKRKKDGEGVPVMGQAEILSCPVRTRKIVHETK